MPSIGFNIDCLIGSFAAEESVDDLELSDPSSPERVLEDYLSWYRSGTSSWDFTSAEDKWYAVRDEEGGLHAASVTLGKDQTGCL